MIIRGKGREAEAALRAELFPIVKRIMDKFDPERLLCCKAPEDEYDREWHDIVSAMEREGPVTIPHLAKIIRTVLYCAFHSWIEDIPDWKRYLPEATVLWQALPNDCRQK